MQSVNTQAKKVRRNLSHLDFNSMSMIGFSQGEGQRDTLTTGFACSEVCGMLSIWEGTYGGTIPGIPNWFGLAAALQMGRRNNKQEEKKTTHENAHYLFDIIFTIFFSFCFHGLFFLAPLTVLHCALSKFHSFFNS